MDFQIQARKVGQSPQTGILILIHPWKPSSKKAERDHCNGCVSPGPDPDLPFPTLYGAP